MSIQAQGKVEISYAVYNDNAGYTQSGGTGLPLSPLDAKLVEIRSYHINWESYYQNEVISKSDYDFFSNFDHQSSKQKAEMLMADGEKCLLTLMSLLGQFQKDHVLQYTIVLTDDILTEDRSRVKLFHETAKKHDFPLWNPLFNLLNREDPIIIQMTSRLIAKLACWSKFKCQEPNLSLYLNWLKAQLVLPGNEYLKNVAECLHWMMRVEEYRRPFVKANGIANIITVLVRNVDFQLQYQLIFSIWMLSFNEEIAAKICESNVIPVLADILRESQKEKVTRIIVAALRNLLEKPEQPKMASVAMIQSKLLPFMTVLSGKHWDDEDIKEDLEFTLEKLNDGVQDLSTFDEYVAEVKSGRLEWSPVHKSEKFWRENGIRLTENNYELLRILVKLLEYSTDPLILAVACHDLGEFVRLYPRGKPAFDALGGKELIMMRMTNEDANVRYEALLAVQKMMVHNWLFGMKGVAGLIQLSFVLATQLWSQSCALQSFFEVIQGDRDGSSMASSYCDRGSAGSNGAILSPEFFACAAAQFCRYVVLLDSGRYVIVDGEKELKNVKGRRCIWKKMSIEQVCNPRPLGMESKKIPDARITASSDNTHYSVTDARLNGNGAWMPLSGDSNPYIQVDFGHDLWIYSVATQGYAGRSSWVTLFKCSYSNNGKTYTFVTGSSTNASLVFVGNTDATSTAKVDLPSPVLARAFTSLYCQIPGLYGENGLYPAAFVLEDESACVDQDSRCKMWSERDQCRLNSVWMLENCAKSCNSCRAGFEKFAHFPTLLWWTPHLGLTTETGMELVCLLGIVFSFFMLASRSCRDCINYFALFVFYFSLVQVGQIFLYYQWDHLLLETGFLAILIAPWNLQIGLCSIIRCRRLASIPKEHDSICFWLVKWLLFRLMFGSGIVKLLWMDVTWWNLTALNWHYESQCIPNPFAWYMAKLPKSFHQLCVVFTYLIEIVIPFMFFVPMRNVRIFAFSAQVFLQIMIMSTGNYNYFNLITIALCFSLLQNNDVRCRKAATTPKEEESNNEKPEAFLTSCAFSKCFPIKYNHSHSVSVSGVDKIFEMLKSKCKSKKILILEGFMKSKHFIRVKKLLKWLLFASFIILLAKIAVTYFGIRYSKDEFIHSQIEFTAKQFLDALPGMIQVAVVLAMMTLKMEIVAAFYRCITKPYTLPVKVVAICQCVFFGTIVCWIFGITLVPLSELHAQSYRSVPTVFHKQHKMAGRLFNAYGLFRSMTGIGGRPEVILMGADELSNTTQWKEYNFIYKPGSLFSSPTFNVPHQPRLDWQMWFASLGDAKSKPWFVNLCHKLLSGEKSVLNLMAEENPFKLRPPKYIRSVLYRYHYTSNNTGFFSAVFKPSHDKRWWTREYVKEYMPIVTKNDTGLIRSLERFRLIRTNRKEEGYFGFLHQSLLFIRKMARAISHRAEYLIFTIFAVLLLIFVVGKWWRFYGIDMLKTRCKSTDEAERKQTMLDTSSKMKNSS
eukprot:gene11881-13114_t